MTFTETERVLVYAASALLKIEKRQNNQSAEYELSQIISLSELNPLSTPVLMAYDANLQAGSIALRSFDVELDTPVVYIYQRNASHTWQHVTTLAPADFDVPMSDMSANAVAVGEGFVSFTTPRYLSSDNEYGYDLFIAPFDASCHPFQAVFSLSTSQVSGSQIEECVLNAPLMLLDDTQNYTLRHSVQFGGKQVVLCAARVSFH